MSELIVGDGDSVFTRWVMSVTKFHCPNWVGFTKYVGDFWLGLHWMYELWTLVFDVMWYGLVWFEFIVVDGRCHNCRVDDSEVVFVGWWFDDRCWI